MTKLDHAHWWLPNRPATAGQARVAVRRFVADLDGPPTNADDAALVVSELVANALAHSRDTGPDIELELRARQGVLHIEVQDHEPRPPVLQEPALDSEVGRGLLIVDAVSSHWGWATVDGVRKRVWCDVPIEPGGAEP